MGHVHPDEAALIDALRAGDRHAFDRFFESYFSRLFRFVRIRVNNETACEDIVQETLIKAIRSLHGFRGEAALFTWLCQIARSEVSNWYQRNARHLDHELPIEDEDGVALDLVGDNGTDDVATTQGVVLKVLSAMPENYRRVLEMKYFEGLSVTQIAGLLFTGEVAVQSLLARARRSFRDDYNALAAKVMS